jgi:CheY-like chemotaxis protein
MDIDPVPSNYYRFQFREFLQKSAESSSNPPVRDSDILFADIFQKDRPVRQIVPAPQDTGETKHSLVDKQETVPEQSSGDLKGVESKDDRWLADSSTKYSILTQFGIPVPVRREMETEVRRLKKKRSPCMHRDDNGFCSALFIRCGERRQFGIKETREQRNMAHRCKYVPLFPGDYVLIVDADKAIRDFCKTTLELFSGYNEEKIVAVESAAKAVDALKRFKQENGVCGLAFVDSDLPGDSGYALVNELYERNYNVNVIMMSAHTPRPKTPPGFLGDTEIIPDCALVAGSIAKPFHSDTLTALLQPLALKPYV